MNNKERKDFSPGSRNSVSSQPKMPPSFTGNKGRRGVAIRKNKQVWRPKKKPSPPWTDLPRDITANILQRLGAVEILESAQKVCTTWRSVCKDPTMWEVIDMRNMDDLNDLPYDLDEMCRHAVDRSQGQLNEINLEYFANHELLDYIATRSRKLRCLQLASCYWLYDTGLSEAIKRFPQLEELHIILTPIYNKTFEMIGRSCPLLRYFAYNKKACRLRLRMPDEDAFAIARSMPQLRHLQLLGNGLTNVGLKAIIDGCPHLESLDLRSCYHVKDVGDVVKGCSTQIKCLRYPDKSTSDYKFQVDPDDDDSVRFFISDYYYDDDDDDDDYDYYRNNPNPDECEHYDWLPKWDD